jgi:hypothetical protein
MLSSAIETNAEKTTLISSKRASKNHQVFLRSLITFEVLMQSLREFLRYRRDCNSLQRHIIIYYITAYIYVSDIRVKKQQSSVKTLFLDRVYLINV